MVWAWIVSLCLAVFTWQELWSIHWISKVLLLLILSQWGIADREAHEESLRHQCELLTETKGADSFIVVSCLLWLKKLSQIIFRNTHTHVRLTALCPGLPGWAGTRKVKPIWILLKQKTVSGSGISWAICKSAPCSRQITTPAPHHSVFYRPDALNAAQPTVSEHWNICWNCLSSVSIVLWGWLGCCQMWKLLLLLVLNLVWCLCVFSLNC